MKTTDQTRDRKVRMTKLAMWLLVLGLALCLVAGVLAREVALLIAGLYTPFAAGVGAALHLFIRGNVQVHEAQASAPAQPGGAA
jgi:hypothetical protein